ncbi:hypothetical protein ACVWZK_008111 [Bradyrhizobium sp. GM0.4]
MLQIVNETVLRICVRDPIADRFVSVCGAVLALPMIALPGLEHQNAV